MAANPLIVAISVEPQRANNGMILERAPHTENLIEANNVICMQSVAIKRHWAIEILRSEQLKPVRVLNQKSVRHCGPKVPSFYKTDPSIRIEYTPNPYNPNRGWKLWNRSTQIKKLKR